MKCKFKNKYSLNHILLTKIIFESYGIMLDCWNFRSDQRPSFSTIHEKLLYISEKYETELANETLNINLNTPTLSLNFTNGINSKDMLSNQSTLSPKLMDLNKHLLFKRFSNNNDLNKILSRYSESEDSQYFSGTEMSNSLLYVDSNDFLTTSSNYSAYAAAPTQESLKAASIMANSLNKRPPSPPPPQTLETLLNVASKVYQL